MPMFEMIIFVLLTGQNPTYSVVAGFDSDMACEKARPSVTELMQRELPPGTYLGGFVCRPEGARPERSPSFNRPQAPA